MPLLLFAAGHAKRDVPNAVAAALEPFPHIEWRQAEHLGCHPEILVQSAERFREAVGKLPEVPREQTALLFVGRGSLDDEAIAETRRFAQLCPHFAEVATTAVCFYAMAQPTIEETIAQLGAAGFARVVVQPHLLFDGLIRANIEAQVAAAARRYPQTEWIVAQHLGPTARVARAIVAQVAAATQSSKVTVRSQSATD
jgi:sirohydrochlorin ferrochelatase